MSLKNIIPPQTIVEHTIEKFDILGIIPHTMPNAIGLWPNEQECLIWTALQTDPNKDWLEVGSFCGGSTILLGLVKKSFITQSNIIAIDTSFNPMFDLNVRRSELTNIVKVESDSISAIYDNDYKPISFVFLDGWHSFKSVVQEFAGIVNSLTDDAVVAFHDVSPRMWQHDYNYITECCEYVGKHYDELMNSTIEDFRIDEAIAYICTSYKPKYEIIDIPIRQPLEYFKETGLNEWVRGSTSPHNAFTAIRRVR